MNATVVIPVFNRAHLVHRAIDTALAQTVPCEVLVVDHGSTDAIGRLVSGYQGRVSYVRREVDEGPVASWRDGIERARGEYVHLTYDDDWLEPTFMERSLAAFRSDVAFVYTRVTLHWLTARPPEPSVLHPAGNLPVGPLVQHLLRRRFSLSPGCAVFRKSDALDCLLPTVPGAHGRYGSGSGVGEDLLLFLLTALRYARYAHVPQHLANFLAHDDSITVNAISAGRARLLADAYERAKEYYLVQPDALARESGARRLWSAARWVLGARALTSYASKALRRGALITR